MKKKLISILLVVAMLMGSLTCIAADDAGVGLDNFVKVNEYPAGKFADVPTGAWYEANVKTAYELGLVRGSSDTRFGPDDNLTIAEALAFACRLHSIYYTGAESFVQGSPWYQVYVDYAIANSIIGADEFASYDVTATRAQFASIFARVFPVEALAVVNDVADGWIPDVDVNAEYASGVYMLYRAGVLTGNDATGVFKPDSYIIRAEVATIVTRMADESLRRVFLPIETPDVGGNGGSGSGTGSGSGSDGGASPEPSTEPSVKPSDENIYHPNGVTEAPDSAEIFTEVSEDIVYNEEHDAFRSGIGKGLMLQTSDEGLAEPGTTMTVDGYEYTVEYQKYTQLTDEIVAVMSSLYRETDELISGYRRLIHIDFSMHAGDTISFDVLDYPVDNERWPMKLDDFTGPYYNSVVSTTDKGWAVWGDEIITITATNPGNNISIETKIDAALRDTRETQKNTPIDKYSEGIYLEFDICADCEDDVVIPYVERVLAPTDIEVVPGVVLENHGNADGEGYRVDTLYDRVIYFESFYPDSIDAGWWAMEKGEPFGGKVALSYTPEEYDAYYQENGKLPTINYIVVYPEAADGVKASDLTPEGYVKLDKVLDYYEVNLDTFSGGKVYAMEDKNFSSALTQYDFGIDTYSMIYENDDASYVLTARFESFATGKVVYFDYAVVNIADLADAE